MRRQKPLRNLIGTQQARSHGHGALQVRAFYERIDVR
jgi:hypothetical protein